jgi:hypothetical protein
MKIVAQKRVTATAIDTIKEIFFGLNFEYHNGPNPVFRFGPNVLYAITDIRIKLVNKNPVIWTQPTIVVAAKGKKKTVECPNGLRATELLSIVKKFLAKLVGQQVVAKYKQEVGVASGIIDRATITGNKLMLRYSVNLNRATPEDWL